MKDIPVFTTDFGVASLILKEIPYRGEAYIRIQDLQPGTICQALEKRQCLGFSHALPPPILWRAG